VGLREEDRHLMLADGAVSNTDLPKSGLKDDLFSLILDGRLWRF